MTRSDDRFIPLGRRVAISNARRSKTIFVSVHFNWSRNRSASGFETYYYNNRSPSLARNIQRSLLSNYRTSDRGVKHRGFYVIRKNSNPAVLVECGFLSNSRENAFAQTASGREKIAAAIAQGIIAERRGN